MRTVEQRFNEKVTKNSGEECWSWTAATNDYGYGILRVDGKNLRAHRISWEIHVGPIPPGMRVLHRCDNPPCTNPDHLFCGTMKDNTQDMLKKGRNASVTRPDRIRRGSQIGTSKLTEDQVVEIKRKLSNGFSLSVLAGEYNVDMSNISIIKRGIGWKHVPWPN